MRFVIILFSFLLFPLAVLSQTFEEVKERAENGSHADQSYLASMYEEGAQGAPKDLEKAAEWYLRAAEDKSAEHLSWVGRIYDQGIGVPQDHREAYRWYYEAAMKGYAVAAYSLGYLVARTKQDKVETFKWFMVSLELSDPTMTEKLKPMLEKLKSRMAKPEISAAVALADKWLKEMASFRE